MTTKAKKSTKNIKVKSRTIQGRVRKSNRHGQRKKEGKIIIIKSYRKKAVGRGYVKKGSGIIRVNNKPLEVYFPEKLIYRIMEPIYIAGEGRLKDIDIRINVEGGGITGQSDVVRQIISKALVEYYEDDDLKETFLKYDRSLLVPDPRQTEPHKPSRSKQGPRRKKQLSKR